MPALNKQRSNAGRHSVWLAIVVLLAGSATSRSWAGPIVLVPNDDYLIPIPAVVDTGKEILASFFALDVNAPGHWPTLPFGSLRLHDSCSGQGAHPCTSWNDVEPSDNNF